MEGDGTHLGSHMSNNAGSVLAFHTSPAGDFRKAFNQVPENGSKIFPSPATAVIATAAGWAFVKNSAYFIDANAAHMYSSKRERRSSSDPRKLLRSCSD